MDLKLISQLTGKPYTPGQPVIFDMPTDEGVFVAKIETSPNGIALTINLKDEAGNILPYSTTKSFTKGKMGSAGIAFELMKEIKNSFKEIKKQKKAAEAEAKK